jgi:DNA-binding transcriptional ArsR family regulator
MNNELSRRSARYIEDVDHVLAETAALLSDPARAAMLTSLMDGKAMPAGQLALIANIAPQTASSHLSKLVNGRLLAVERQGRHRYYRLATIHVARAIEAVLAITPRAKIAVVDRPVKQGDEALCYARTCYSHLAGRLAVEIADALKRRDLVVTGSSHPYQLTDLGRAWFEALGIPFTSAQVARRRFAHPCLDWTERRHHIAGDLGSALLRRFRELRWVAPIRDSRAVRVTITGERELANLLGIKARR